MLIEVLRKVRRNLVIILVVALALGLRISHTSYLPPALNWDEVSHGYNAYSILKTGKDEWGVAFPTIFRAYGDYKLPVYIYLTLLSEYFLGLTDLAVRLPSILAGTLSVLFTYLLVCELFKKKGVALLSASLLALEPWGLFVSRIAVEANVAVFLIIAGVYFFLKGLRKRILFPLSLLSLGLSVWTYNSARIFVPLLIVSLIFVYRQDLRKVSRRVGFVCLSLLLVFFLPMFYQLVSPTGRARYAWVEILDQGSSAKILEARASIRLPDPLPRLVSNKVTYFGRVFLTNYFSHFSPEFLFLKGGTHYQFNVPEHGLMYLLNLPFFVIGLFILAKNFEKNREYKLLVWWLLLAPIASSLTREAPHALRGLVVLPIPMIVSAIGIGRTRDWLGKNVQILSGGVLIIYIFLLGASLENYLWKLIFEYRPKYSWAWQHGYGEVVDYLKQNYYGYDTIIVTKKYGEPHEFILFFWPWDPARYGSDQKLVRFNQSNWYWVDRFDKFFFVNDWQIPKIGKKFIAESKIEVDCESIRCLLVSSPGNFPAGWRKLKTINFLDNQVAFEIFEN